ncbi:hypothetical protein BGZ63DRAFT_33070 [Mariannaea sp. PMI_226]|nr:hypothetical protein BGZ63DRAFT_33070 [Mariannaea sp. PMI_226]
MEMPARPRHAACDQKCHKLFHDLSVGHSLAKLGAKVSYNRLLSTVAPPIPPPLSSNRFCCYTFPSIVRTFRLGTSYASVSR